MTFRVSEASTATPPDPLTVICVDLDLASREVPQGFVPFASIRDRRSADPRRQMLVEQARQRLAAQFLGEGASLRKFRMERGLSQLEFAERIGSSQPYVSRVEKNPSSAGIDFMRRLCEAFGIDMNRANELLR